MTKPRTSFYEFFAGGGMARAGLGPAWQCLFANDIDTKKATSYALNWGDDVLKTDDVGNLVTADLPGPADLAWASFPCQDLSLAGNGAGLKGERSGTFWPFWNLVTQLRQEDRAPTLIAIENVCGTLSSHDGRDFAAISAAIAKQGYQFGALVIDAVHFVPQSRPRLFIIAAREDIALPLDVLQDQASAQWHTPALIDAHGKLSAAVRKKWVWWYLPSLQPRSTVFGDLIEENPNGVSWHTRTETRLLLKLMSPINHQKVAEAKESGQRMVGTIYKRTRSDGNGGRVQRAEVRFDDIAGCLRTPVGGSSRQLLMLVEGSSVRSRLLSPREAARLMGLPDEYQLPENYNEAYHLAGDGLVVPVVRYLAKHVLEPVVSALRSKGRAAA